MLLVAGSDSDHGFVHADAQEPATRAETLQRQREEKAKNLAPPEPNRLERR